MRAGQRTLGQEVGEEPGQNRVGTHRSWHRVWEEVLTGLRRTCDGSQLEEAGHAGARGVLHQIEWNQPEKHQCGSVCS